MSFLANANIPSTGHPVLDAVIVLIMLAGMVFATLRDGAIKGLRKQLADVSELLERANVELDKSREMNADLKRRLHDRDIELAEMRGRTDFEPVRMMLKELVTNNALMSQSLHVTIQKLTDAAGATAELCGRMDEIIKELRGSSKSSALPISVVTGGKNA